MFVTLISLTRPNGLFVNNYHPTLPLFAKAAYNKIIKDHLSLGENPPAQKSIAQQLGISEQRLTTAIRATGGLLSVDAPIISPGSGSYKGSAAGGDGSNAQELLILDTLRW